MEEKRHKSSSGVQLLLLEDIEGLGRKGELVTAKPGHARNFLVPRAKGVVADRHTIRMQTHLKEERSKQAAVDRAISEELASQVHGLTLATHVKVDQDGHMYGSVKDVDVVAVLGKEGITVEKKFVQLHHPIKEIGLHQVQLKLKEEVQCRFNLKVIPEGMDDLPEPPAPEPEPEVVAEVQEDAQEET